MAGISISVLGLNDEWLRWLDAATTALHGQLLNNARANRKRRPRAGQPRVSAGNGAQSEAVENKQAIEAACQALIDAEGELTELDAYRDGDLGAAGSARQSVKAR